MKELQTRLTLIIFSIFLAGWIICGWSIWSLEYNGAKKDIISTATLLLDTANVVRDYTSTKLNLNLLCLRKINHIRMYQIQRIKIKKYLILIESLFPPMLLNRF